MPAITSDGEPLLSQVSDFLINCNGEQVRCSPDNCEITM